MTNTIQTDNALPERLTVEILSKLREENQLPVYVRYEECVMKVVGWSDDLKEIYLEKQQTVTAKNWFAATKDEYEQFIIKSTPNA